MSGFQDGSQRRMSEDRPRIERLGPGMTPIVRQPSGGMPRTLSGALQRERSGQLPAGIGGPGAGPLGMPAPGAVQTPFTPLSDGLVKGIPLTDVGSKAPLPGVKEGQALTLDPAFDPVGGTIKAQQAPVPPEGAYFRKQWRPLGLTVFLLFLTIYCFYFYVRIAHTLGGGNFGYAVFVLVIEFLSSTNMLLYGLLLTRKKVYTDHPVARRFHIRVLIPCYSESLEIVQATMIAAMGAALPPGVERTVYVLDDGKDPDKKSWVKGLADERAVYIPGHVKVAKEINGKAHNLNSALSMIYPPGRDIPLEELLCVFDADMVCTKEFFIRTLPRMMDDKVSIVLTPQAFHNYRTDRDVFNHSAFAYWNVMVPGEDAWGHIVCTGSNFLMRARPCLEVGGFPTYTMCEDFALALEFQAKGLRSAYVQEFLAVGEVPVTIRGTFQQRSRWCKGGMQIWFSRRNWWVRRDIGLLQKIIWSISCWGYMTHSISCPVFLAIPVIGVWLRIFPLDNNIWFAAAFTAYFVSMHVLAYWCNDWVTFRSIWFAAINSNNMWFTFLKAWTNVLASKVTNKQSGFKVTPKSGEASSAAVLAATGRLPALQAGEGKGRLQSLTGCCAPGMRDLWMPTLIFFINLATIGLGIYRLYKHASLQESLPSQRETFSLVVSVAWAIYNIIPPTLLLHYAAARDRALPITIWLCSMLSIAMVLVIVLAIWLLLPTTYNFGQGDVKALAYSMKFYQAEWSGVAPSDNAVPWRSSSALQDSYQGLSLVGGFYDGGNGYVKPVYAIATSTAMLAWGLLEFPKGYARLNQTGQVMENIRHGADFLKLCAVGTNQFVVQVGSYAADSTDMHPPEQMTQARPAFLVNATSPGSDIVGSSAAALAAASIVFQTAEPAYSAALLSTSKSLYTFATTYTGLVSDSVPEVANTYFSTSYMDDLAWAAIWLYKATNDSDYLTESMGYKARSLSNEVDSDRNFNVWDYQNSLPGVNLLLARATQFSTSNLYTVATEGFLKVWMMGWLTIRYTPRLLAFTPDAPIRNAANAAFLATMYAKHKPGKYACWAESQARYILGSGGRSYMVGYGKDWPMRSLDKVAMCSNGGCVATASSARNPHVNYGAVVDGPSISDTYYDDRSYPSMAGVHLDTNAGVSSLLAALNQIEPNWASCTDGVNFVKMKIQGRPI